MTNLTSTQILTEAKKLIENPENWFNGDGWYTLDAQGKTCNIVGEEAVKFSMMGAIMRVGGASEHFSEIVGILNDLLDIGMNPEFPYIESWEIKATHSDAMNLMNKAIREIKARHSHSI